jgi:acetylornithine aminotransferase
MTVAQEIFNDPRIAEAKKLIKSVFEEKQGKFTKLLPPSSDKAKMQYDESLKSLGENRGGKLFYDYIGSGFGSGPFVELADGSTKYDFITGIGVHYFGHSHPGLIDSLIDGAISNTVMQGNLQQNTDSEKLIDFLLKQSNLQGAALDHCFLTSSGAMANENALKIAFQKRAPASRVMAFKKSFHGRTMSVSQITDKPAYRAGLPKSLDVSYISFYDYKDHEGSIKRALDEVDELLKKYPGEFALFLAELIQGEAGSWPGHKDFFRAIFTKLRENNVSIIDDEVQSFGRTDKLFAFQYFEIDDLIDLVCIGKMSQVCATFYRKDHQPKPGLISQTFTSSSTAIRASYYILSTIVNNKFLGENGKINKIHNYFKNKLQELSDKHPDKIEGPYGVGAMVAMTLYKGDMQQSKDFTLRLFENGVMSFIAGSEPTRVRMLIPMGIIETWHIDEVVQIIEKSL